MTTEPPTDDAHDQVSEPRSTLMPTNLPSVVTA